VEPCVVELFPFEDKEWRDYGAICTSSLDQCNPLCIGWFDLLWPSWFACICNNLFEAEIWPIWKPVSSKLYMSCGRIPCLLIVFFTSSNQAPITCGSSHSLLWLSYVLPSLVSSSGVLLMKLFAQLTPTGSTPLALQIVSAISLTRLIVGDSPWASSFRMVFTVTSSTELSFLSLVCSSLLRCLH